MVSPQGVTKQRFTWGGFAPRSNPLLFYTPCFERKGVPLSYTVYWQPSVEVCIPFKCWKCTAFIIWINHKTRTFSRPFHNHRMHLLALLGLSDWNDRFCYPFIYLKGTVSRYCACTTKLWFLDRMSRNQKMRGE